jgi:hypothetical protein
MNANAAAFVRTRAIRNRDRIAKMKAQDVTIVHRRMKKPGGNRRREHIEQWQAAAIARHQHRGRMGITGRSAGHDSILVYGRHGCMC